MRHIAWISLLILSTSVSLAQTDIAEVEATAQSAPMSEYGIEIDTLFTNIGTLSNGVNLGGFNTYRLFLTTASPNDQLSAIYGDLDDNTFLWTTGVFFQDSNFGAATSEGTFPAIWSTFPENEFDSFVTIGIDGPAETSQGEGQVSLLESTASPWIQEFESGQSISIGDVVGGGWYALPSSTNGIAGADQRILIAQITTDGDFSGIVHAQLFLEGNNFETVYLSLPFNTTGCTAPEACNYSPVAIDDDGSCEFALPGLECGQECPDDDADGICNSDEVLGCTDPTADNFDPDATEDSGACFTEGCTYSTACNFSASADLDDGSCTFPEPGHQCDGSCVFDEDNDGICDQNDFCFGSVDTCGVCNGPGAIYECGCAELPSDACDCDGQTLDALGVCGGDCSEDLDGDGVCDADEILGCSAPEACNYDASVTDDDGSCDFASCAGCTSPSACNFSVLATLDDGSCSIPGPCDICQDGQAVTTSDDDNDGICNEDEIWGCTLVIAYNYNPAATEDDGTCKVDGCPDSTAINFSPLVTDNDGSCEYLCIGMAGCTYAEAVNFDSAAMCDDGSCTFDCPEITGSCVLDYDGNGLIGANDLVYFLGWYELPCEP